MANERIIHFDNNGEITLSEFFMDDVETIEMVPVERFAEIEDSLLVSEL